MAAATRVLNALPLDLELEEHLFGGIAIRELGDPLPLETLTACLAADAVLLGAVGLPELVAADVRPEQGLIRLRQALETYANLRPARVGGLDHGPRGRRDDGTAFDTCEYHPSEIERVARRAFELARMRSSRLTSVDKANVL